MEGMFGARQRKIESKRAWESQANRRGERGWETPTNMQSQDTGTHTHTPALSCCTTARGTETMEELPPHSLLFSLSSSASSLLVSSVANLAISPSEREGGREEGRDTRWHKGKDMYTEWGWDTGTKRKRETERHIHTHTHIETHTCPVLLYHFPQDIHRKTTVVIRWPYA